MFLPSCRWWPFIGILFFALPVVLGHFGFGCTKTDPDIPTDPDVPAETQDVQVLAAPDSSSPAIPTAAFAILPLAGGIAAAALGRWRDS